MAKRLTFGFIYDFRNPAQWHRRFPDLYAETLEFIAWTEEVGFDAAWVPEHHIAGDGYMPSPTIALAAIAARTKRLRIGSAVALAPFHHPVRFAEDCAIVDVIADGRLEVGVALGYRRLETDAYGIDFRTRVGRMEEFLQVIRRLWEGETVSFDGKHFQLTNAAIAPLPPRGHIPLLIGGFAEKAIERIARFGDAYMGMAELGDVYLAKLRACGKDPATARIYVPSVNLVVADDPERTMHELAPYYHYVNNIYGVWLNEDRYESRIEVETAPKSMSLEEFKLSGLLQVLTPAQAIDMLKAMQARAPVEHVMLTMPPGVPFAQFARHAELFARQVMPAFR
jgi:alkanesulfonate monooxygenase SsuD/methylene tetrahydromethanopterin reductase-like flavin-dependent oxidoreductase (luciferase family)